MLEKNSDSEVQVEQVEQVEQRPTASIAFGLERIGLIAVQAPILSCIILVGLIIGAIFGIDRIKIDDSLSQLFRSNSREYRQYEAVTKRFPATEFELQVGDEIAHLFEIVARQQRLAFDDHQHVEFRRREAFGDRFVLPIFPGVGPE